MEDRAFLANEFSAERKLPTVAHKDIVDLFFFFETFAKFELIRSSSLANSLLGFQVQVNGQATN